MIASTIAMSETRLSLLMRVRDLADAASWNQFDEIYRPVIFGYLRSLGLEEHDAHELAQEVFQRLLAILPTFELDRTRGRFRTYLWKLTHNAMIDWVRRGKVRDRAEKEWGRRFCEMNESESRELEGIFRNRHRKRIPGGRAAAGSGNRLIDGLGVLRGTAGPGPAGRDDRRRAGDQADRRLCLRLAGLARGPAPLRRARGGMGRWLRF